MTSNDWTLVKSIFGKALDIPPSEREAWTRSQSELPTSVMEEVLRLLWAEDHNPTLVAESDTGGGELRVKSGEVLLDRFLIEAHLGSGGMGDVYRATDKTMGELVAVKTLRSHLTHQKTFVSHLRREVQFARRIRHRNVCQIFEFHQDFGFRAGPLTFFTMELLEGVTLAERLSQGRLELREIPALAASIANGLDAIHSESLIHRDLKPSNIFLVGTPDLESHRVVIADFGLCYDEKTSIIDSLTAFGQNAIVGTPAYMAPEQLLGKGATKKSDIYSLGVILFQIVTGQLPFNGATPLAVALRRLREKTPSPRRLNPNLPAQWEFVIVRCLDPNPDNRPNSASEVIDELSGGSKEWISARWFTRRHFWIYGTAASLSLGGFAVYKHGRHADRVSSLNAEAIYHFKLGQEFAKQTSPEAIRNAILEFQRAVVLDADYGEAWAEMADAYCMASTYSAIPSRVARKQAEIAAKRAISLSSRLSKAEAALAYSLSIDLKRWQQSEQPFRRAIELDPREPLVRSWFSGYLGRSKRFGEAIAMAEAAVRLDPGSFRFNYRLGTELLRARHYTRLLTHMQHLVRLHPAEASAFWTLARAYEWLRRFDEAEAVLRQGEGLPNRTANTAFWATLFAARGRVEEAIHWGGKTREAWMAEKQETNSFLSVLGALYKVTGAATYLNEAVQVLREGIRREDETVLAAASNAYLDPIKGDLGYRELLWQLGFTWFR